MNVDWIYCDDELPEFGEPVLATWRRYFTEKYYVDTLTMDEHYIWHHWSGEPYGQVVAWIPLPKPALL